MGSEGRNMAVGVFSLQLEGKRLRLDKVRESLLGLDGVSGVEINYVTQTAWVEYDPRRASRKSIRETLEGATRTEGALRSNAV